MKRIEPYTFGMGDRFGAQGRAQLEAILAARKQGIDIYPTWNKSFREHHIVGTEPASLGAEAAEAVKALGWTGSYYVDADHIRIETVDGFIPNSNFFTLDVADFVGKAPAETDVAEWIRFLQPHFGEIAIEGLGAPLVAKETTARAVAGKYLAAIVAAGKLYRHIESQKGRDHFVTEVSIDETDQAQSPEDLFYLLSMMAHQGIPVQTVAPKFTGRFNKGVDYVGDLRQFEKEFDEDLCIIRHAVKVFGLPDTLKISVHSGSDKFSIYPIIKRLIRRHGAGLHVKTAGTTWLEEVIALARSGGEALVIAKEIYAQSLAHFDELAAPYATVIDIDKTRLPGSGEVNGWTGEQFAAALEHEGSHPGYNPNLRQLLHVGFKIAAKMGARYQDALREHSAAVGAGVRDNLLKRHIIPIFGE